MFMFRDRDVLECEHCGHLFRDTSAERGWRVEEGRLMCKRCPSSSLVLPVALIVLAVGVIAFLLAVRP